MENEISHLKLEDIIPNEYQPREILDEESLNELANSIKQHGVIQPIIVRRKREKYEIVDGYRRYLAAISAGLTKIPTLLRNYNDNEAVRIALIDNLQRKDLSSIEEARAYKHLLEIEGMKQEQLASSLGKSQSTIANKIRLLNLPFEIQESLLKNEISERHARSLLGVTDTKIQIDLLKKIIEKRMTVRELDSEIKNMSNMFIPEEYVNNNSSINNGIKNNVNQFIPRFNEPINPNEGLMNNPMNEDGFISPNSNNNDNHANMFVPNNYSNSLNEGNNVQENSFIPNSGTLYNQMNHSVETFADNNVPKVPIQPAYGMNDNRENPFLASEDVIPPSSANNNNNFNPFSSIRLNSNQSAERSDIQQINKQPMGFVDSEETNFTNLQALSTKDNINIENESSSFNIDDYKLPGMSYEESSNMEETPIDTNLGNAVSDYKYIEDNPNYTSADKPQMIGSIDEVIKVLQDVLFKIKNSKLKVETEETDYDDSYEIVIKIDKKGSF